MWRLLTPWMLVSVASAQIEIGPSREISDFINQPRQTRAVDMDGDGDLDILAAESATVRVLWWENDGEGNFSNRREWLGEVDAEVLSLADHDGDSRPDIWYAKSSFFPVDSNEVWIVHGQAGGGFGTPVRVHANALREGRPEAVADVDGDGRLDILTWEGVCLGLAAGGFGSIVGNTSDGIPSFYDLLNGPGYWALGDFSGDPGVEFACFGHAAGSHATVSLVTLPDPGSQVSGVPAYVFSDEEEETRWMEVLPPRPGETRNRLLVQTTKLPADEGGETLHRLRILEFPEDGPAVVTATLALSLANAYAEVRAAQLDESGQRLLIAWDSDDDLPNSRAGWVNFNDPAPSLTQGFDFTGLASGLAFADLDGDEIEDLVIPLSIEWNSSAHSLDQITWHRGTGGGSFESAVRSVSQPSMASNLAHAGDIDGDGDGDVITNGGLFGGSAVYYSDLIIVWRNEGGSFSRRVVFEGHDWVWPIVVRDLNGDSRADLIVQAYDLDQPEDEGHIGVQRLYRGIQQVDGSFQFSEISQEQRPYRDSFVEAEVDWDGDGIPDLLLRRPLDSFSGLSFIGYQPGIAAGGYGPVQMITGFTSEIGGTEVMDMDRDGDPDLLGFGGLFNDYPYWFENDGSGEIQTIRRLPHVMFPGGDIDGDGFRDFGGQDGSIYASRPGVSFEFLGILPENAGASLARAKYLDLDGDGDSDRVDGTAAFGNSGTVGLGWLENRNGVFEASYQRPDGDPYDQQDRPIDVPRFVDRRYPSMCDMDGDGIRDLVVVSGIGRLEWFKITRAAAPVEFGTWMGERDLEGNAAGPLSDWDGDGVSNWNEFAFGADPAVSDPACAGLPRVSEEGGLSFTFQRRTDAGAVGLAYPVQSSTDLVEWEDLLTGLEVSVSGAVDGYERVSLPLGSPLAREFLRLVVPDPE